jgi:putative DNA-invertase from lambdoid prophage Rac
VHCLRGIQELASLGIRFIATSRGLDTDESNPASELLMHMLAAVAQFERELIRERVQRRHEGREETRGEDSEARLVARGGSSNARKWCGPE